MGRGLVNIALFLMALGVGLRLLLPLNDKFPDVWMPLALAAILYGLLALVPRASNVRLPYAILTGGGALLGFFLSREKLPPEKWDKVSIYAPYASVAIAAVGLIWWIVALSRCPKKVAGGWLFAVSVCAWLIAYFSSGHGAAGPMQGFLERLLHVTPQVAHAITIGIRKTLHYGFYGTVGLTGLLAARRSGSPYGPLFGLLVALSFSCFDEYRQSFFPDRGSSILDVGLDMIGAVCFVAIASAKVKKAAAKTVVAAG